MEYTFKKVSGDVGRNVFAGEKQITWKVIEERDQLVGESIKFKVLAYDYRIIEPEMVFVEGGKFQMGIKPGTPTEQTFRTVTISSYNIGKYEIKQSQWIEVMGSNPSYYNGCDNCPVEMVSWEDVQEFIKKLNFLTGKNYRLPTEAEWEYAARGGKKSRQYIYSGSNVLIDVAWHSDNCEFKTHEVGLKRKNELGIYDMSGNVWEWCSDWYGDFNSFDVVNPSGAESGEHRVIRGGSWFELPIFCPTALKYRSEPSRRSFDIGFRLVLPVE